MRALWTLACLLCVAAFLSSAQRAEASDPAGVYAQLEDTAATGPVDGQPTIQLFGVFALAVNPDPGRAPGSYTEPQEGYLYLRCPAGKEDVCEAEWADLVEAVGSASCAAFGDRYLTHPEPNARVRAYDEPLADPDAYPIGMGVMMIEAGMMDTCSILKAYRQNHPPVGGVKDPESAPPASFLPRAASQEEPAGTAVPTMGPQPEPATSRGGGTGALQGVATAAGLGILLVAGATVLAWRRRRDGADR